MPLQFINPALQGAKGISNLKTLGISNLKTLLLGGGPVGAMMLGASQAPGFIEAGRQNPTGSSRLSILGSMGSNLPGSITPRPPMPGLPAGYKEQELAQGTGAEAFRPGAGFPGQQQFSAPAAPLAAPVPQLSPQDRAYQQERARVEAMVKSNPDMQKQEIAEARAKVRDQGMAIWAAKHGGLAKQVKPGQSGYEAIQKTLYSGGTPVPTMSAESEAMLNAIAPANQQGVRPNVTPMPGQLPSFGSATEGMFNAITDGGSLVTPMPAELIEKYKEQLLERAK